MASSSDSDSDDHTRPAIWDAIYTFDAEALRRELAAGVDPNLLDEHGSSPFLFALVLFRAARRPAERMQERLECLSVLLEAGASVDLRQREWLWETIGRTPLHRIAHNRSPAYTAVIAALVEAGADVNFTDEHGNSVLARAAGSAPAATVSLLISAGAVDLDRALKSAIRYGKQRNCALLLRAGAAIPAQNHPSWTAGSGRGDRVALADTLAYVDRIRAAESYKAYERAHRQRLVAIFAPKFPHLPTDMLGRVLEFSFNVGGY